MKKITLFYLILTANPAFSMLKESHVKHAASAASVVLTLGLLKLINSPLEDRALKRQPLDKNDPLRQLCIAELTDMNVPNAQDIPIKIDCSDHLKYSKGQARHNVLLVDKAVYDDFLKGNYDKEALQFLIRHEVSHIKNRDALHYYLAKLVSFNAFLYGASALIDYAQSKHYLSQSDSFIAKAAKALIPIALAYKAASGISNVLTSYQEDRADKEAVTNLAIARGGVRLFNHCKRVDEKAGHSTSPFLQNHPWLHRLFEGRDTVENRGKTLEGYVRKFEQQEKATSN